MQKFLLDMFRRIRSIKWRELEPWQIVLMVVGALVAIYLAIQIVRLLFLPAIALGVIYAAYQFLSSRSEDIPDEAKKSRKEREVEEAVANYAAAQSGEVQTAVEAAEANLEESFGDDVNEGEENEEETTANLIVKQIVNPETGFKEPDISRLIEHEKERLKESDKVTQDIMAQLEARKKRLNQSDD